MNMVKVSLNMIDQNENSRISYKTMDLSQLMDSMSSNGLLQPVGLSKLKNGRYEAVFGNRRIVSAKKLGWTEIDAIISDYKDQTDKDIVNLVENFHRVNTTVNEDGRIFDLLKSRGLSEKEIAARLNISTDRVVLALHVIKAVPKQFRSIIVNRTDGHKKVGTISATAAKEILNIRRDNLLNESQVKKIFNFVKKSDGLSSNHLKKIGVMIKNGKTINESLKEVDQLRRITIQLMIPYENIKKLETKHKLSIYDVIWNKLSTHKDLEIKNIKKTSGKDK